MENFELLALCSQIADLTALYLSLAESALSQSDVAGDLAFDWSERLWSAVGNEARYTALMHDGFVEAMRLNGVGFEAQMTSCQAQLSGPSGKG